LLPIVEAWRRVLAFGYCVLKALPMKHSFFLLGIVFIAWTSSAGADPAPPEPTDWVIAYSPHMPRHMDGQPGNYFFDFPATDGVHYITASAPSLRINQTITMHFVVVGEGKLVPTEGPVPARVRLFLQQRGDLATAAEASKRWWSVSYVDLNGPGEFTLSARLAPAQWSNVFGKNGAAAPDEFETCLANLENIGFTFGGMFAGHGVYVTGGKVRFILRSYVIEPRT
jgi:hypothetical protein